MRSTDLRIGNWVQVAIDTKIQVLGTYPSGIEFSNGLVLVGDFRAIPITPKILDKAGFIDISGDQVYAKMNLGNITFAWHIRLKTIEWASVDDISIKHITNLHQLQNLYHSLFGEELKIEL